MHLHHLTLDPALVRDLQAARFERLRRRSARPRTALAATAPAAPLAQVASASDTVIELADVDPTFAGACR